MADKTGFDFFGFGDKGFGGKPGAQKAGAEKEVRTNFWRTAKRAARQIPFMEDVVAAYYCAFDKETPLKAKAVLIGALGYFVLPTDVIPDIILGLGFTDDIAVLTAAITTVRAHIKPAHRLAAREAMADKD